VSLRRRLVAGILLLLLVAVVVTDVVTYSSLRSSLMGRLDEQIDVAQDQALTYIDGVYARDRQSGDTGARHDPGAWLAQLGVVRGEPGGAAGAFPGASGPDRSGTDAGSSSAPRRRHTPRLSGTFLGDRVSPDVYVVVLGAGRRPVYTRPSGSSTAYDPHPVLPRDLAVERAGAHISFASARGPFFPDQPSFEMPSVGDSGTTYRAQAVSVPGGVLVTAISLVPVDQTLGTVVRIEVLVSLGVMLAAVLVALLVVRFGLRPLEEMTDTATAIGAGDLTRRVQHTDERTEVGRLGHALNAMLTQIEAAFDERSATEVRLRRFVADASHELRTPLTSIRGYAELLRKDAYSDEDGRHRAASRIEHEAVRLGEMVDDLLLLARLDQGRPLSRAPVDLCRVAADAVDDARVVQPERTLEVHAAGSVVVMGDAGRLRQVVDNMVRNALVHTPLSATIRVTVRSGPGAAATSAVIEVADDGPGLEPEQLARVFDRFYRASAARTGEGTGLGLSIVSSLAAAHGGRARATSEPGRGSVFTVELPLAGAPDLAVDADADASVVDASAADASAADATDDDTTPAADETTTGDSAPADAETAPGATLGSSSQHVEPGTGSGSSPASAAPTRPG
jgi:two-component system OmpR family sensor kinase